ncbi:bifunctional DNA primase/polymerase [Pleomorphomonas oryzae]|uniref:bifunctional DNA primase/polymerase n=1 Tax=Pleomorphomonas oryzae TaxID=261934 RepID=UPI00041FDA43|nr:bifunctional DNA primase/polymerase [Pleomorphomonas oryzae]
MTRLSTPFAIADLPPAPNRALALDLARAGLSVFPVRGAGPDAKKPCPSVRWGEDATTDVKAIDGWWRRWPDAMPAIHLGRSGLLVVDLDRHDGGEDGIKAWDEVNRGVEAPAVDTPSGGRHIYFRQPEGRAHGNREGLLKGRGINIRGLGGYVVAPGALRADGEGAYQPVPAGALMAAPAVPDWLYALIDPPPASWSEVAPRLEPRQQPYAAAPSSPPDARLRRYADKAIAAEIDALGAAGKGGRNNQLNRSAFALGQMVGAGWITEGAAIAQLSSAAEACGLAADDGLPACLATIRSGLRKGRTMPREAPRDSRPEPPRAPSGPRRLVKEGSGAVVDQETGEVVHEGKRARAAVEFPDALTHVPGLVGDITDWICATARRPNRVLALGAALTLVGTAMGRFWAGPTLSSTVLYMLALAPSGVGKDHALQQIKRLLAAAKMTRTIGPDEFISMPAVIHFIEREPLSLCPMDEFGAFLKRINAKRASGFERGISKIMRSVWGTNFGLMTTPEWAATPARTIRAPALSIYGASTPEDFFEALDGGDVSNGFLNRFTLLTVASRTEDREPKEPPLVVPEKLSGSLRRLFGGGNPLVVASKLHETDIEIEPFVIPWGPGAEAVYTDFQREILAWQDRDADAENFIGRAAEMAVRMATICAGGRDPVMPRISEADMQWGRAVALWSARTLYRMGRLYISETDFQAEANRVLRIIDKEGGEISQETLRARMKNRLRARELREVIETLEDTGAIVRESVATEGGGPRKTLYFLR